MKANVSLAVVRRLPRYWRCLNRLREEGVTKISSKELSERIGFTASQIRQDFNCFGDFGQQGYGYSVETLCREISAILGVERRVGTILLGAGALGSTVIRNIAFGHYGFQLLGVFDVDEQLIGKQVGDFTVLDARELPDFCRRECPEAAVLAVPSAAAPEAAEKLAALGIHGIWNFSHADLDMLGNEVAVENVHLSDSLMTLAFRMNN